MPPSYSPALFPRSGRLLLTAFFSGGVFPAYPLASAGVPPLSEVNTMSVFVRCPVESSAATNSPILASICDTNPP